MFKLFLIKFLPDTPSKMSSDTQISCLDGNADPGYGYCFFPSDYKPIFPIRRPSLGLNPALTVVTDEINLADEEDDEIIPTSTISCHVCFRR